MPAPMNAAMKRCPPTGARPRRPRKMLSTVPGSPGSTGVPGVAVVHDGEVVVLGPSRWARVGWSIGVSLSSTAGPPPPISTCPPLDLATASSTARVDATMAVVSRPGTGRRTPPRGGVGADQSDLRANVGKADDADPQRRHQEVRVGPSSSMSRCGWRPGRPAADAVAAWCPSTACAGP